MKPAVIALPLATLLAGALWLGAREKSIAEQEERNAVLEKEITARRMAGGPDGIQTETSAAERAKKNRKPAAKAKIDWKHVIERLGPMMRGEGTMDIREMVRLQGRVQNMDTEEILAALEEIKALDLPAQDRAKLEDMLLGPLSQKAPRLAMDLMVAQGDSGDGMVEWRLGTALGEWARKDLAAAIAWMDGRLAAGEFGSKALDGRNPVRAAMERALISSLLASDPEAAAGRLSAIPASQRAEVFRGPGISSEIPEASQLAFAKMIRENLPEKDQGMIIAGAITQGIPKDFSQIDGYLSRISATQPEREAVAKAAALQKISVKSYESKISREDVDQIRSWVGKQSAEAVDRITGEALGSVYPQPGRGSTFDDITSLALEYHAQSGSDELLVGFLKGSMVWQNKEKAREIAGKISDPKLREENLNRFK